MVVGTSVEVPYTLAPADASDLTLTWENSDDSVAKVTVKKGKLRIKGLAAGTATLTGTARDQGLTVQLDIEVIDPKTVLTINDLRAEYDAIRISITNNSDLTIDRIMFQVEAWNTWGGKVHVSNTYDGYFKGTYKHTLLPGETTEHNQFSFYYYEHGHTTEIAQLKLTVTGFVTSDGTYYYYYQYRRPTKTWNRK